MLLLDIPWTVGAKMLDIINPTKYDAVQCNEIHYSYQCDMNSLCVLSRSMNNDVHL